MRINAMPGRHHDVSKIKEAWDTGDARGNERTMVGPAGWCVVTCRKTWVQVWKNKFKWRILFHRC